MVWKIKISVLMFGLLSSTAYAASFNCDKASTFVEEAICSDLELSSLDDQLGTVYRGALQRDLINESMIKQEQKDWLKARNACSNVRCLKGEYQQRIARLSQKKASSNVKPLLVLERDENTVIPKGTTLKYVELAGKIGFFHDAAGGSYGLMVGGREYLIRYVGFISDEQQAVFQKMMDDGRKVTVKGLLRTYKDGGATFDDASRIVVY